jgi:hypothetical protein
MIVEKISGRDSNDEEVFKTQNNFNGRGKFIRRNYLDRG